jgi:tetratricopeptide (TPR) repeat protein
VEGVFSAFRAFVGRERELDLLRRGLDKAISGQGGLFLVNGSRGMGKTSLIKQLACDARALGVRSIFASRRLKKNNEAMPTDGSDGDTRDIAADTLPVTSHWDSRSDGESWGELFSRTSVSGPALLIFEDIHRWNTNTLNSLAILASNIVDTPTLAVATCCEREIVNDPLKRALFVDVARLAFHLTLVELDEAATRELVQTLLGRQIDSRLVREIFRATGGNPLVIQHALQAWYADLERFRRDQFEVDSIVIPFPVRDLFTSLLAELSRASRELLSAAAVIGPEFAPDVLARVFGLAGRELFDAVDEAEQAGLLEKDPDREGHFRFRHSLLRQLLYRGASSFRKAEIHCRAARAIEALGDATANVATEIVEHLQRVFNQSVGDGQANGTFDEGAEQKTRVRADFLLWLGENQVRMGSYEAALETLTSASELAARLEDATRLANIVLALPNQLLPLPGTPNFANMLLAEKVLNLGQMLDVGLRAQVCARLAADLSYLPEAFARAKELMNDALGATGGYPPAVQLRIRLYRDSLLRGPEALDHRIDNARAISDLAAVSSDRAATHFGFLARVIAHLERGEIARAQSAWNFAVAAAGTTPALCERLSIVTYRASRALSQGRLDEAWAFLQETDAVAAGGPWEFSGAAEALVLREQGLFSEAREAAQKVAELSQGSAMYCTLLALTELDLGREREAKFHFERVFGYQYLNLAHDGAFLPCGALLAELCVELRDLKRAAQLYSMLIPYGAHFAVFGQGLVLGPVSLHLGIIATALGLETARQHLEEALRMSRSTGLRLWGAYANYHLGQCLAMSGDGTCESQSRGCVAEAMAEAEASGMVRLLHKMSPSQGSAELSPVAGPSDSGEKHEREGPQELDVTTEMAAAKKTEGLKVSEEGDTYLLTFCGRNLRLRKSKGLKLMVSLIRDPGREFHVLDLECAAGNSHGGESPWAGEGGPQLDGTAKHSYRMRLRDLRSELEEAQRFNDSPRASLIEEEIGFLARELARAVGLKGSDRKTFSDAERARVRVTQGIHLALQKISGQDAAIGWYVAKAIRTGTFCSYRPVPAEAGIVR